MTDAGLEDLARIEGLESLKLTATDVTDNGLRLLSKLKNLKSLNLTSTNVTEVGVGQLQKALPDCEIVH